MNINKMTEKAQEAIVAAQRLAEEHNHSQLDVEHLLFALVDQQDGVVPQILQRLGVDPRQVRSQVEALIQRMPRIYGPSQLTTSPRLRRAIEQAFQEANRLTDEYVSTEHLLLGILEDTERGGAGQLLRSFGVTRERVFSVMQQIRGGQRITDPNPECCVCSRGAPRTIPC